MKPLPICYCRETGLGSCPHIHTATRGPILALGGDLLPEIYRLRRYERAVVRWVKDTENDRTRRSEPTLRRLAAASVKRDKKVRRA